MRISILNGSPKLGKSTSALLIEYFLPNLKEQDVAIYNISRSPLTKEQISELQDSEALIFAFPLYIDSIPAHLLKTLVVLEDAGFQGKDKKVYCIVNNGFYEGTQNRVVIQQMKLWCDAVHLTWGQAIGTGAGEMYPVIRNIPFGHGPTKNVARALAELANHVLTDSVGEDRLISVNWPRFLWRWNASSLVWYPRGKANGLKKRDMLAQRVKK